MLKGLLQLPCFLMARQPLAPGLFGTREELPEPPSEGMVLPVSLIDEGEMGVQRIKPVGFSAQIHCPVLDGLVDDRILIYTGRQGNLILFDRILVDPEALIEDAQGRFKPPGRCVTLVRVQTFVIQTLNGEHHQEVAAFGQERVRVDGGVNINQRIQLARFLVVFQNPGNVNHGGSFRRRSERIGRGRIGF